MNFFLGIQATPFPPSEVSKLICLPTPPPNDGALCRPRPSVALRVCNYWALAAVAASPFPKPPQVRVQLCRPHVIIWGLPSTVFRPIPLPAHFPVGLRRSQ